MGPERLAGLYRSLRKAFDASKYEAGAGDIAVGAVVLREAGTELTTGGEWTVMAARFLGPVLLALAVLAVRARVKR